MWTPLANAAQSGDDRPPPISAAPGSPRTFNAARRATPGRGVVQAPPRRSRRRRSAGVSPRRRPSVGRSSNRVERAKSVRRSAERLGHRRASRVGIDPDHNDASRRETGHRRWHFGRPRPAWAGSYPTCFQRMRWTSLIAACVLLDPVVGSDDQFRLDLGAFEVAPPVRDDAVGRRLDPAGPQRADDRVEPDGRVRLHGQQGEQDLRVGVQRLDARRHPRERRRRRRRGWP